MNPKKTVDLAKRVVAAIEAKIGKRFAPDAYAQALLGALDALTGETENGQRIDVPALRQTLETIEAHYSLIKQAAIATNGHDEWGPVIVVRAIRAIVDDDWRPHDGMHGCIQPGHSAACRILRGGTCDCGRDAGRMP